MKVYFCGTSLMTSNRPDVDAPNNNEPNPHCITDILVRIRGLKFNRGSRAIFDGVDIDIPRGGVTAIMGPSGTRQDHAADLSAVS